MIGEIEDHQIIRRSSIHHTAKLMPFVNIYDSEVGENSFVGPFVELGGCTIGKRTKISSHSYVCPGVKIGDDCFIAHGVLFCNDSLTVPAQYDHTDELAAQWKPLKTKVGNCVRIGSGAVILPGIVIHDHCIIGAGAVVTHDVVAGATVAGVPARVMVPHPRIEV